MKRHYTLPLSLVIVFLTLTSLSVVSSATSEAKQNVAFLDQRLSVEAGVIWLIKENQNDDGGFGFDFATGDPASNVRSTLIRYWRCLAGYSADANYYDVDKSAIDYLKDNSAEMIAFAATDGGSNGKVILALSSANKNARAFPLLSYVAQLQRQYDEASGSYNNTTAFSQALSLLALAAVDEPTPEKAFEWLGDLQADDGSWGDGFGTLKNADATAMAVMALLAGGRETSDPAVDAALGFLADSQLDTGGWEYGTGFGENANSTALVVQALSAAGEDFYANDGEWAMNGTSPLTALLSWQNTTGAYQADFGQGKFDDFFATAQAIPASTGKAYPLPSRFEAAQSGVICLSGLQDRDSGGWEQFAGVGVNAGGTSRAIEAIAATGGNPQAAKWTPGEINAVKALENGTDDYLTGFKGGPAGIVSQAVVAAGDPYSVTQFGGRNLPQVIDSFLDEKGEYDDTTFGVSAHSEAMLGLLVAGNDPDPTAVDFLLDYQADGDWGSPDGNGIALNVLGRLDRSVPAALDHLKSTQQADGGWGYESAPSNPSSTSEVVQGLVQQGENPYSPNWSKVSGGKVINPADLIMAQQQENGCWPNYNATLDDPFSTTDAVILLDQLLVLEPVHVQLIPVVGNP